MNNAVHEMVRIETADLDAILKMPSRLPIRVGSLIAGLARNYQVGDRFVLDLGNGVTQCFSGKRFKFVDHLQESYSVRCEKCREWRKRLFLTDVRFGRLSRSFTHSLECKECVASRDTKEQAPEVLKAFPKKAIDSQPSAISPWPFAMVQPCTPAGQFIARRYRVDPAIADLVADLAGIRSEVRS